jgi:biofilm PGA synthesis protein PgaD
MWAFWIYLFLPLVNLVLWLVGIRFFYIEVIEKAGYLELLNLLGKVGWAIIVVFLILRLWGLYNYRRFGRRERRKSLPVDTLKKLAEHFEVQPDKIIQMQSNKEIVWPVQKDIKHDVAQWIANKKIRD